MSLLGFGQKIWAIGVVQCPEAVLGPTGTPGPGHCTSSRAGHGITLQQTLLSSLHIPSDTLGESLGSSTFQLLGKKKRQEKQGGSVNQPQLKASYLGMTPCSP